MHISTQISQGTCNVTLQGEFTFNDHPAFREILDTIGKAEVNTMVAHMEGVTFVDSAALGMLLLALDEARTHNTQLILSGATGQVKKMFDMARFHALFTIR